MGAFEKNSKAGMGLLISNSMPFAYTEAFKTLRTNLSFASVSKKYKKIVITSSVPDEGKSTLAVNLAQTLGESGSKVLLIDGDLRNPTVHQFIRSRASLSKGLTALLTGEAQLSECIYTNQSLFFDYLLAGTLPPNPVELLGSSRMNDLLTVLEKRYDYIICDAPPVGLVTDATVLGRYCDGVLLVVRQGFATREQVRTAKANLEAGNANIIGTIMTHYDLTQNGKNKNSNYGYYYGYGNKQKSHKKR